MSFRRVGALLLTGILLIPIATKATPVDLDLLPHRLPYEFITPANHLVRPIAAMRQRTLVADVDRDGFDEMIELTPTAMLEVDYEGERRLSDWQYNILPKYLEQMPPGVLGAVYDITDDGFPEIFFVADGLPAHDCALMAYDIEQGTVVLNSPLPRGRDMNEDGRWDGVYNLLGMIPKPNPLIIITREAGYDRYGRGILAFDARTGELAWEYLVGGNPIPSSAMIVDLDNDGMEEIVFCNSSPENLGGELVNGTSDDICRLHVLEADGKLRWTRILSGAFSASRLDVADLDADGEAEIITVTLTHRSGSRDRLTVWNSSEGDMIAQTPVMERATGVVAMPSPDGDGAVIIVGFNQTGLQQYRLKDGHLGPGHVAAADRGVLTVLRLDVFPDPGQEIITQTTLNEVVVLDPQLNPLARYHTEDLSLARAAIMENGVMDGELLVLEGMGLAMLEWRPRPRDLRDWLEGGGGYGVAALLVIVVVAALRYYRKKRGSKVESAFPVRDIHARLLSELAQASHNRLGVTGVLDRLATQFEYLSSDLGRTYELSERMHATWEEFQESDHPRLLEIIELARGGNIPPALVRSAENALMVSTQALAKLTEGELDPKKICSELPGIKSNINALNDSLKRILAMVESYFVADLARTIRRIALLREEEFLMLDVNLELLIPEEDAWLVRIDPADLRFVIDNLVGNALRSFEGIENREYVLTGTVEKDMIQIEFRDTGCGIDPALHRRIFSSGYSAREGGGLGLARSREIMADCGGELLLGDSTPGEGTAFLLRLKRANDDISFQGETK